MIVWSFYGSVARVWQRHLLCKQTNRGFDSLQIHQFIAQWCMAAQTVSKTVASEANGLGSIPSWASTCCTLKIEYRHSYIGRLLLSYKQLSVVRLHGGGPVAQLVKIVFIIKIVNNYIN